MIKVEKVDFHYENGLVLENVSFSVKEGEFLGIFGPNGGGKTTLLKLLMGFLKPKRGKIVVEPKNTIGYVPQISNLDRQFPITVLDVVMMGCLASSMWRSYSPGAKERAIESLRLVGMEAFQKAPFGTLSGGQTQRVLIARALASSPKILFLDEPTASVDMSAEQVIYKILTDLKGKMTIVMVTHDLQAMSEHVDRFLCVQRQVTPYSPTQVCDHFAKGLYHPPLRKP